MGVYEAVKDAAALAQEVGKMDLYRELVDAMKKEVEQERVLQTLEARIAELEEALAFGGTLEFEVDVYWSVTESGKVGPYCTSCWDDESKPIRLHPGINPGTWQCPKCDTFAGQPSGGGQPMSRKRSVV